MMGKPLSLVERAVDAQAVLRETRRQMAPLYEAALRLGNAPAIAEAKAVAESIRIAERQAHRLAGIADGLVLCGEGLFEMNHGRAA
jgi:hypothetical protein